MEIDGTSGEGTESTEAPIGDDGPRGPWQGRVRWAPGGGLAYTPGVVLVRSEVLDAARGLLARVLERDEVRVEPILGGRWGRIVDIPDPLEAIQELARVGVVAQVDHVLFATCCCPPHPGDPSAAPFYANPFYANAVGEGSFAANPFYANPFYANAGSGGCCCGCRGGGAFANPFYANPFYANATESPFAARSTQESGRRRSSARPAEAPDGVEYPVPERPVRIAVLDTGYAEAFKPSGLEPRLTLSGGDRPSEDGDGYLDPAAGHGTFIAGLIEQLVPGCEIEVIEVLSTYGDGKETNIATRLSELAARTDPGPPHVVNLSFGTYSPFRMSLLEDAIGDLREKGTVVVASAGNDGSCAPLYPAAFEHVVGVAALVEDEGAAAPFTNYGPWVDACTAGVDLVSTFFEGWNGDEPEVDGTDVDRFDGWAVWSGTSFAAPRVVAALAAHMVKENTSAGKAAAALIEHESVERRPMLGAVVVP